MDTPDSPPMLRFSNLQKIYYTNYDGYLVPVIVDVGDKNLEQSSIYQPVS